MACPALREDPKGQCPCNEVQLFRCRRIGECCRFCRFLTGRKNLDIAVRIGADGERQGEFAIKAGLDRVAQHGQTVPFGKQTVKNGGREPVAAAAWCPVSGRAMT